MADNHPDPEIKGRGQLSSDDSKSCHGITALP